MSVGKEIALLFAVLFLPGMIAQGGRVDPRAFENILYHVQLLVTAVPQVLLVVAVSNLRRPGSAGRFGWNRPGTRDLFVALAGLAAVWVAAALVSLVAGAVAGGAENVGPAVEWTFERPELLPLLVISTLAIGYREEIFYRAYLADRAAEADLHPRVVLAAGALVFATGHLYQGVAGFVMALAIGIVLGEVYLRTKSLHGIAVAHGVYNFLVLVSSTSA
ncbi:MAG: CPBP family intramembrane glutamic endopeptidase [Spirochaetota bacterium]